LNEKVKYLEATISEKKMEVARLEGEQRIKVE